MRITRPYGRTVTDGTDRKLAPRDGYTPDRDITAFATTHPELLVAQWISSLDKIAAKPKGQGKPTEEQRKFRNNLGAALWKELAELLPMEEHEHLHKLWQSKVHPYPDGNKIPKKVKSDTGTRGRWYKAFCGEARPLEIDAKDVAQRGSAASS